MKEPTLRDWYHDHRPSERMSYAQAFHEQCDYLITLQWLIGEAVVIATHRSKSINLPVVQYTSKTGVVFTVRDNFHNFKLSVESPTPLELDGVLPYLTRSYEPPRDLSYTGDDLNPSYFEGFPENKIFGPYSTSDKCRFSVEFADTYRLYTLITFCLIQTGGLDKKVYPVSR